MVLLGLLGMPGWMKLTCQICLVVVDEKSSHWCLQREKAGEKDNFSPEHVYKGRRHGSLFPWDQMKLALEPTHSDVQPMPSTLSVPPWHKRCLTYRISLGPPGDMCCETALRSCTKESPNGEGRQGETGGAQSRGVQFTGVPAAQGRGALTKAFGT